MYQSLLCPECGHLNMSESANSFCSSCGARLSQPSVPKKKAARPVLYAAILTIAAIGFIVSKQNNSSQSPLTSTRFDALAPSVSLPATHLHNAYESNELDADERYKGRIIEVLGTVERVGKGVADKNYVSLKAGTSTREANVICFFSEEDKALLTRLQPGHTVIVRGLCEGKIGNVVLKDCALR